MRAKLSSTLAGMALLQRSFLPFVLGPVLGQRPLSRRALEDTAPASDECRSHRLEEDALRRRLNYCFGSVLDFELLAKTKRDDNLPFCRKPHGVGFVGRTHALKYYTFVIVRQYTVGKINIR